MERFFQITAVILAGVAAYFLWQGNGDGAFISAVFASVSFFLSVRFQIKARNDQRERERLDAEERAGEEEFEEDFEDEELDAEFDAEFDENETPRLKEIPAREQLGDERRTTNDEQKI